MELVTRQVIAWNVAVGTIAAAAAAVAVWAISGSLADAFWSSLALGVPTIAMLLIIERELQRASPTERRLAMQMMVEG
jgi:hypothetical protein